MADDDFWEWSPSEPSDHKVPEDLQHLAQRTEPSLYRHLTATLKHEDLLSIQGNLNSIETRTRRMQYCETRSQFFGIDVTFRQLEKTSFSLAVSELIKKLFEVLCEPRRAVSISRRDIILL